MNKFLTVLAACAISITASAQSISIDSLRRQAEAQRSTISDLVTQCEQIDQVVDQKRDQLQTMAKQILALNANQSLQVIDALKNLEDANKVLDMAKTDCINGGLNRAAPLLEMYLIHVDTNLMELKHGVGQDLKRIRN